MKCVTVVGTRPEFVQIATISRLLRQHHSDVLVNTGQHYDDNMSQIFFSELGLPLPDYDLGVGSSSHAQQTGEIMMRLEPILQQEQPDWVIVFGDTNSTVAAAMVAAKLHLPLAHIEAGLRSFDRDMPEEVNRVVTDHISQLLFAPTDSAVTNLANEGITEGVHQVGDVRVDILQEMAARSDERQAGLRQRIGLAEGVPFALTTIHRPANTDDPARLGAIVDVLNALDLAVVLPIHPRLRKLMDTHGLKFSENVRVIDPVGFLDMVALLQACEIVITDSGGLQKEAYLLHRPTVTVRDSTEWIETVHAGWNRLCEPEHDAFMAAVAEARGSRPATHPDFYGAPGVNERIMTILHENMRG